MEKSLLCVIHMSCIHYNYSFFYFFLASFYDPAPEDPNFIWDYRGAAITIDMNEQNKENYCISKTNHEGKLSFTNK